MLTVTILLVLVIGLLFIEKWIIQRSVSVLQLRIHVNGTRGKSSVTEYIRAGLLHANFDTMAKVTGIVPTYFLNGNAQEIHRTGVTRVQEQMGIIRLAAKKSVRGLVMECMSVSPELQRIESKIFRPHFYVITNIRDDHREDMGKNIQEQAEHMCSAIPENCTVLTNEVRFLELIKEKAGARKSRVISIKEMDPEPVGELPHGIFPENILLALAVCDAAGMDHRLAKEGILNWTNSAKQPLYLVREGLKEIRFLNAFSVNDIGSTNDFVAHWRSKLSYDGRISLLLNTRADRPVRTDLFVDWIAGLSAQVEHIIITGNHSGRAKWSLMKAGMDRHKIHRWSNKQLNDLKSNLLGLVGNGGLVIGVGNIGGSGFHLLNGLR